MITFLFIASLLAFVYSIIAGRINAFAKSKIANWQAAGAVPARKPDLIELPTFPGLSVITGLVVGLILAFWMFIVSVGPQEVMVVKTPTGVIQTPLYTGWRLVLPWYETYPMDRTQWVYTFSNKKTEGNTPDEDAIWAPTSEGIKMGFDMSVSWRIDPKFAPWIYQNISDADGTEDGRYKWIEDKIIRTKTKSIAALTISKYTPLQCYSAGRIKIQVEIKKLLERELQAIHIILDEVDIREVFYDPAFETELKNTKIEEQKAKTMVEKTKQNSELLVQERIKKDIAIEQARGESESLRIKGLAINQNPKVIELNLIEKWDGVLPTTLITSGGNNQSLLLNLAK